MTLETPKIDPLTAFASENRTAFAGVLLFFAVLFAGLGVYGFNKGLPAIRGDSAKVEEEKKPPEDAAKKQEKVNGWEYICAGVAGAVAGLALVGIGFAQLVGYPKPTIEERHSDARTAILIAGGAVGLCLMLFGAALFICRVEALTDA